MVLRKVIRITAWDSPNVRLAQEEIARGERPSNRIVMPGVLTWDRLQTYLRIWDKTLQQIKLKAEFPEGAGELLFPRESLELAWQRWEELKSARSKRTGAAMGIDPGEGRANTSWAVADRMGLIWREDGCSLISRKTPDTSQVPWITRDIAGDWQVPAERWVFDRGGGGYHHACRLRNLGYKVQTVMFGDKEQVPLKRGLVPVEQKREVREQQSAFKNLRAEMYWTLSDFMAPARDDQGRLLQDCGFAIPPEGFSEEGDLLIRQLRPIPRLYDDNGKAYLPSKKDMIAELYNGEGSPDEADALVLAVYGLTHKSLRAQAGAV